jgi:hypothetical protein
MPIPLHTRSILATALALALSSMAYADTEPDLLEGYCALDRKTYPAAFCDSNKPGAIVFTRNGRAVNPSTSNAYDIICPLIGDHGWAALPLDDYGYPTASVFKYVGITVNKKSNADIPCYMHSRMRSRESGYIQTYTIRGAADADDYWASFENAPAGGSYNTSVGCKIPKATGTAASTRSSVTGYYATETSVDYDSGYCSWD